MARISAGLKRNVEAILPGFAYHDAIFYRVDGPVVQCYLIDRTPSFWRVYESLILLPCQDLGTLTWADQLMDVERSVAKADVDAMIVTAISDRHVEVQGERLLDRLIARQASWFARRARDEPEGARQFGPPEARWTYAMALLVKGDMEGCRSEAICSVAIFAFYYDEVDGSGSSMASEGVAQGRSWPRRVAYRAAPHDLARIESALSFCAEFERDPGAARDQFIASARLSAADLTNG